MKKRLIKALLIISVSLIIVISVALGMISWFVFTPEKITPIVRKQVENQITCKAEIGEIESTFFSTFPYFGVKINRVALINPYEGAQNDTLIVVEQLVGTVDVGALLFKNELLFTGISINNGSINAFIDSLGNNNFNIFLTDTSTISEEESESMFSLIDLGNIELKNIDISYIDHSLKIKTIIKGLDAGINGEVGLDQLKSNIIVNRSTVSLEYEGEEYLNDASVQLDLPATIGFSNQLITLNDVKASVNGLGFTLGGNIQTDSINGNIVTDISYKQDSWQVKDVLNLVPSVFRSYLEGLAANGKLTSTGSIKGNYNETTMPVMDIHIQLEEGDISTSDLPFNLKEVSGDINIYSDLVNDSLSYIRINKFNGKTPNSNFEVTGTITNLLSDIRYNLTTKGDFLLDEFNSFVPADLKTTLKGKVRGQVKSDFSMSQVEKMQLDKMKISGNVALSNLDIKYDSLSLKTDYSEVTFAFPNPLSKSKNTKFAFFKVAAKQLKTNKVDGYYAMLQNAKFDVATSNFMDTTTIPNVVLAFKLDSIAASMDTISIAAGNPSGTFFISPGLRKDDQPKIRLVYNGQNFKTVVGRDAGLIEKLNLDVDIVNDNSQKDIFQQWMVKGFVDMENGYFPLSSLAYPLEVSAVKMNFDYENLDIKESQMKIGGSDFQLKGNMNNVLSYFRGDSLLRGDFNFFSNNVNVPQLINLTNGINNEEVVASHPEDPVNDSFTGPYMVPKGMDLTLRTNIKNANMYNGNLSNILGNVNVKDGVLIFDEITCQSPAAKIQLTSMYSTPRKNHLYFGLDYHLLDVEIEELLKMIPDIDTIMPMLRSFRGKGEFHMAVETYTDSLYNVKKSTIRGASSIKGQNLVLMDGETFSEIAKKLMFNKKTQNKVDSLSAEFTIFKDEIDIYPFMLVMDKYKAVISGRHNFDLSFNYHISVVDCPLPVKLGIDVKGTMENMSYDLVKCKYAEFYRPAARKVVENKQLELRNMIRNSLVQKVTLR